jgi:site-specific DNA-methyltransferase (adenine-specific)
VSANRLVHADACAACDLLPADVGFDLVYLDPPFATGSVMSARQGAGQARGRKRRDSGPDAYADPADPDALVAMLVPVFERIRARLRPAATLYVHLDHRAVHEVKVAMDGVFGRGAFQGELIWTPGNGARGKGHVVTHQTLLVYARKPHEEVLYNADDPALREPFAATSLSMHFQKVDEAGRRYRERTIAGKSYRYYADEGRRRGSVWTDLPAMIANTPLRKEGTGYPHAEARGPARAHRARVEPPGSRGRRSDVRQRHHPRRRRAPRPQLRGQRPQPPSPSRPPPPVSRPRACRSSGSGSFPNSCPTSSHRVSCRPCGAPFSPSFLPFSSL